MRTTLLFIFSLLSIAGIFVGVKGATKGTTTDINGNFSIKMENGGTLVFRYLGYDTQEVNVKTETRISRVSE